MIVTHDPRIAATADRAVALRDGRIVEEARAAAVGGNRFATIAERKD